jgi:hypothetical protein
MERISFMIISAGKFKQTEPCHFSKRLGSGDHKRAADAKASGTEANPL